MRRRISVLTLARVRVKKCAEPIQCLAGPGLQRPLEPAPLPFS